MPSPQLGTVAEGGSKVNGVDGVSFADYLLPSFLLEDNMLSALKKIILPEKVDKPQPNLIAEWANQNQMSPDVWQLEQYMWQLIFVPYDFQRDFDNKEELETNSYMGAPVHPVCYSLNEFNFFVKDLGVKSFPIPMPEQYVPSNFLQWPVVPARVKGSLWAIRPQVLFSLDKTKLNTVQFRRQRVRITLPYREVRFDEDHPLPQISPDYLVTCTAWMYIGIPEYWDDQIGGIFKSCQVERKEFISPKKWITGFYEFENPK